MLLNLFHLLPVRIWEEVIDEDSHQFTKCAVLIPVSFWRTRPITMATLSTAGTSGSSDQIPSTLHTSTTGIDYRTVQEALSNTARHLQNLDKFLETNREVRPIRDSEEL